MRRRTFISTLAAATAALLLPATESARRQRALPPPRPAQPQRLTLRGGQGYSATRTAPTSHTHIAPLS